MLGCLRNARETVITLTPAFSAISLSVTIFEGTVLRLPESKRRVYTIAEGGIVVVRILNTVTVGVGTARPHLFRIPVFTR